MKRRITADQLNELTDQQKERLREWWKPQEGDFVCDEYGDIGVLHKDLDTDWIVYSDYTTHLNDWDDPNIKQKLMPLLDIGQMIDLILDKTRTPFNFHCHTKVCDALWESVKYCLEV